jgi:hypothetical protein
MATGLNIASRIEQLAGAGGICVSMDVERQIRNALEARFEKFGSADLKNIKLPMDLFRIVLPWEKGAGFPAKQTSKKLLLLVPAAVLVILALLAGGGGCSARVKIRSRWCLTRCRPLLRIRLIRNPSASCPSLTSATTKGANIFPTALAKNS